MSTQIEIATNDVITGTKHFLNDPIKTRSEFEKLLGSIISILERRVELFKMK